ncbi:hypothetical protein KI387_018434, partial [Taxus chinensis]
LKDTMEEALLIHQDSEEVDYLSNLADYFDGEVSVEISTFISSSFILQHQDATPRRDGIQGQHLESCGIHLELRLGDLYLPRFTLDKEEEGNSDGTIFTLVIKADNQLLAKAQRKNKHVGRLFFKK